jgi:osmoprotectant transport system permease protein
MIPSIWAWLTSPENWGGTFGIANRLAQHVGYSLLVVLIAAAIGIPLGLWVGHAGRGRWLISAANAARAVPTLGLLFALALWVGPHIPGRAAFAVPSIIALVLLAIPPILAGTYAGVGAVSPAAKDAAKGIGMTPQQVLTKVEIPCALPLMWSGLRSAVLQVVATATIAAYIGLGGLGRFLIDGLAQADYAQTAGGAILVCLLALAVDGLLALVQRLVVSPGLSGRARTRREIVLAPGKDGAPGDVAHSTSA